MSKVFNAKLRHVEGLRAVAVLSVIFFHLDAAYLPGGYLGVDVFFVISGFVITLSLTRDEATGKSLSDFYARRVARLLPACAATIVCTLMVASLYSIEYSARAAESAIFAALSVSNIFFWAEADYFSDYLQTDPFLHTWSLGVEEQFYLIWPLAFAYISPKAKHRRLLLICLAGALLALVQSLSHYGESFQFYSVIARAPQFLIGILIAFWWQNIAGFVESQTAMPRFSLRQSQQLQGTLSFLGLGMLALLFAINWNAEPYLTKAVAPSVAVALLIITPNSFFSAKVLQSQFMVFLGSRSYALYLVHWPIAVFLKMTFGRLDTLSEVTTTLFFVFIAAECLYRYVERRFRLEQDDQEQTRKLLMAFFMLIVAILCAVFLLKVSSNGGEQGLKSVLSLQDAGSSGSAGGNDSIWSDVVKSSIADGPYTNSGELWTERQRRGWVDKGCSIQRNQTFADFNKLDCVSSALDHPNSILILGDSFAPSALIALRSARPLANFALVGGAGCLVLPIPYRHPSWPDCNLLNDYKFGLIERPNVGGIVLTTNWRHVSDEHIKAVVGVLEQSQKPFVIFGTRPIFTERVPDIYSRIGGVAAMDLRNFYAYDPSEKNELLKNLVESSPLGTFIDMFEVMCPDGICPSINSDGREIFLDTAHITAAEAERIGRLLASNGHLKAFWRLSGNVGVSDAVASHLESFSRTAVLAAQCEGIAQYKGLELEFDGTVSTSGNVEFFSEFSEGDGSFYMSGRFASNSLKLLGHYTEGPGGVKDIKFKLKKVPAPSDGRQVFRGFGARGPRQCVVELVY